MTYDRKPIDAVGPGKSGTGAGPDVGPGKKTLTESLLNGAPKDGETTPADASYGGIVKAVTADDVSLVSDARQPKTTEVAKLKKTDRVTPVDLGTGQEFNKGAEGTDKTWWKVKVLAGTNAGKEGWIQTRNLGSILKVTKPGTLESTTKVGEGSVEVHTGQALEREGANDGDNNFALTYQGKDADQVRFLQFIWREIVGIDDKGVSAPVKGSITTSGGTYDLTDNGTYAKPGTPSKKNYNTDSPNAAEPFYEGFGEADRTADAAKMIDLPGAATGQVKGAFRNGAQKVASRAHFNTFLIKDRKVTFKTAIDIAWDFPDAASADAPKPGHHTVSGSSAADALPATIAERFHEQYPAFKDIK